MHFKGNISPPYIWFVPSFTDTIKTKCRQTDGKTELVDLITNFNETYLPKLMKLEKSKTKKNQDILVKQTENEKISAFEVLLKSHIKLLCYCY
jgi:hypothetical protein